ncbi:MAG: hypothetical protein N3G22_00050 [Candidatus Micrarchaeota archaeon]|nr:hypothetical protein [Candidatus Micrarchaeota archaeon]
MSRMRLAYILFAFTLLASISFAQPTSQLQQALEELCGGLRGLVPVAAMLMVLLASVIYAVGQMMGAETRARANVWATSCLTGAIIGLLIASIAPEILNILMSGVSTAC